jgi:hypothetical protein
MPGKISPFKYVVGDLATVAAIEADALTFGNYTVHIRGAHCSTMPAVFQEFASALQFPYYFGYNLDALYECLCDVFDDPRAEKFDGLLVAIWDADKVLSGDAEALRSLSSLLNDVAVELSAPTGVVAGVRSRNRSMQVVLHFEDEVAAREVARWESALASDIGRLTWPIRG